MAEIHIGAAMTQFLKNSRLKNGVNNERIKEVWMEVMGATISKYTTQIEILNNTLFITTNVAALKNELYYQKQSIIERINESLRENLIKEVVIK
jgi:hypothetical protein